VELYEYLSLEKLIYLTIKVETQLSKKNHFKNSHNDDYYQSSWKTKTKLLPKVFLQMLRKIPLTTLDILIPLLQHLSHLPKPQVESVLNVYVLGTLHLIVLQKET